jgi:uncharacterized damage-inducible protein DinB
MAAIEHFRRLFAYDDWANREVLAALREAGSAPARPLKVLAHLFSAERLWLERLRKQEQTFPVWPVFTLRQCEAQAAEMPPLWNKYLDEVRDGSATITYRNTKGETWTSRIEDVLMHVIMHSAYHRGQIASSMRDSGLTPAYTDFILAIRQGLVE